LGNLKKVTLSNGAVISYALDGFQRRSIRQVGVSPREFYVYEGSLRLVGSMTEGSPATLKTFVFGAGGNSPEYIRDQAVSLKVIKDHLGSVRMVVDASTGAVIQQIDYNDLGAVIGDTNPGFQPYGFAGGLYDYQTGLVKFGARDYDPEVGRWTSKDPILFKGGDTNLFGYVANDPINFIDPRGLWSISVSLFAGYGGAITIGQNPNGGYFGSVRAGVGIGAGASWDPHGTSPDGGSCKGISTGQYAEGSAHFGPLEAVLNTNSGYSQTKGPYFNRPQFSGSVVPSIGVGAGVSGGFELTFQ
jgi:RHS repeat-associated protein